MIVKGTNKQAAKIFVNWLKSKKKCFGVIVINEICKKDRDGIYRLDKTEIKIMRKDLLWTGTYTEIAEIRTETWADGFEHHILALTGEDENEYISFGLLEKLIETKLDSF